MNQELRIRNQGGYIALTTVLIISAVVLTVAMTVSLLAIGEAQSSFASSRGEDALTFVEGCMEDGLLKAQKSSSYNGGIITSPEGSCLVAVSKNGNTWTFTAATTNTDYIRTVQAVATRSATLMIANWREM